MPVTGRRFPEEVRWPGVLRRELGEGYLILEDGVCGRTTVWEEPYCEGRHGVKGLGYAIHRERPLDMMIVMLGTNDPHSSLQSDTPGAQPQYPALT